MNPHFSNKKVVCFFLVVFPIHARNTSFHSLIIRLGIVKILSHDIYINAYYDKDMRYDLRLIFLVMIPSLCRMLFR